MRRYLVFSGDYNLSKGEENGLKVLCGLSLNSAGYWKYWSGTNEEEQLEYCRLK